MSIAMRSRDVLTRDERFADLARAGRLDEVSGRSLAPTNGTSGDRDGIQPQSTPYPHRSPERDDSS
jgi:hypothetical protein